MVTVEKTDGLGLVEGQVYRWSWKNLERWPQYSSPYWCKSQIAIVKRGLLIDTYWSDMTSDRAVSPDEVNLTFLCDESWPKISKYEVQYFDSSDIVDTRHPNSSSAPIYLRPGAQRSEVVIMEGIIQREEAARSEIRTANFRLERMAEERAKVLTGKLDEVRL